MPKKYLLSLFLLIQIVVLQILSHFPELVEQYYSTGIYPFISKFSRSFFGKIPFSMGDVFYGIAIVWILFWVYKSRKENWKSKGLSIINSLAVVYFLFHILWALNYYRKPLSEKMNLKTDYTQEELVVFTKQLIKKTNEIHFKITKDTTKKVIIPYGPNQIYSLAYNGYSALNKIHPIFYYQTPSIKSSLFSLPLTYMGFGGYLNPFTNEAQVNNLPPAYNLPAITSHEMAHQIGFASESECNFIGFMASHYNADIYFKFSGYTYALRYCLSNIGYKDEKLQNVLIKTINPGILKNFQESENFYFSHRTIIDKGFEIFYDNFLKINQQKDGLESYSKFINLLINYHKNHKL